MKLKNGKKNLNEKTLYIRKINVKYDFPQYETIKSFGESICTGKITSDKAEED